MPPARCGCQARKAYPTARCCWRRWRKGRPKSANCWRPTIPSVMLMALQKLGVRWEQAGVSQDYTVHGAGGAFPVHQADLFMGNAGTAIRPLTAALAVTGGDYTLHGVRPHARTADRRPGRCAQRGRRPHCLYRRSRLPAAAYPARPDPCAADGGSRQCVQPVPDCAADGGAADGARRRRHDRRGRRTHLQALYRDHAEPDTALRRHGAARRLALVHHSRRASVIAARA